MKNLKPVGAGLAAVAVALSAPHALALSECHDPDILDKIVIIPIKASDTANNQLVSQATLISQAQDVRDWFDQSSYGCFIPDVWVDQVQTLPNTMATYCPGSPPNCTGSAMRNAVHAVVQDREQAYGVRNVDAHYAVVVQGALGSIPYESTSYAWTNTTGATGQKEINFDILLHELLHGFGLNDLGGIGCSTATAPFGETPWVPEVTCSGSEESFMAPAVMGVGFEGTPQLTAWERYFLGFVGSTPTFAITRFGNGSGQTRSVRLYTTSKPTPTGHKLVRIKLFDDGIAQPPYYWAEYRTQVGFDSVVPNQVYVYHQVFDNGIYFRDRTAKPSTAKPGSPFSDPFTGIKITVTTQNSLFADLTIEVPGYEE